MELGERAGVFVVADDEGQVGAEFAGLVAMEEVGEAVRVLRDEEGDVLELVGELDAPVHAELLGDGLEGGAEGGLVEVGGVGRELHAHEEEAELVVLMLVGVENVGAALVEQRRDAGHQALLIRAVDEQNGGIFHVDTSLCHCGGSAAAAAGARRVCWRQCAV